MNNKVTSPCYDDIGERISIEYKSGFFEVMDSGKAISRHDDFKEAMIIKNRLREIVIASLHKADGNEHQYHDLQLENGRAMDQQFSKIINFGEKLLQ